MFRVLFALFVFFVVLVSPVSADDVIENGDFYYNYSGWDRLDTYSGTPTYQRIDWGELNATTHEGYIRFNAHHGAAACGWMQTNLSQEIDFTNVDTLYIKAKTPKEFDIIIYNSVDSLKMSAGNLVSNRFSYNLSWDVMPFDVSSLSGIHTLTIEFYSQYLGSSDNKFRTIINVDWVRSDGYSPPEDPSSINFYPDVDDSNESYQHFDYNIHTSNQTFDNYFVTSTYAPESYSIVTYQNNISSSYSDSNVSLDYYLPTGFSNYSLQMYGTNESSNDINTASLIAESDILYLSAPMNLEFIMYDKAEYTEYDTARIYYNISSFTDLYPGESFYMEFITPTMSKLGGINYGHMVLYEDVPGSGGYIDWQIGEKDIDFPMYDNLYAEIYKGNYLDPDTINDTKINASILSEPLLDYNHTLVEYTGFDFSNPNAYRTGNGLSVYLDIFEYLFNTDDDDYTLGNNTIACMELKSTIDYNGQQTSNYECLGFYDTANYRLGARTLHNFEPYYSGADFNATHELQVYLWNTSTNNRTNIGDPITVNSYNADYVSEEFPEAPPDDPYIPDPIPDPDAPDDPDVPDDPPDGPGANQTVNVSFTDSYYTLVDSTVGGLCSPVYDFTAWSLAPVTMLNSNVEGFNDDLSISFVFAGDSLGVICGPLACIFDALPPKIINAISYFLVLIVLLIILGRS